MSLTKEEFFDQQELMGLALTYDDVRMRTRPSQFNPSEVDIVSRFSKNIEIKVPIISAAMDTVTESKMAITMAKLGGLGVIHGGGEKPEDQKREVRRVKLHLNGLIDKPISVERHQTLDSVLNECSDKGWDFRTFPVVNREKRLVGLLTQNDFEFSERGYDKVSSVMTPMEKIISAPSNTTVGEAYEIMLENKKKTLPLVNDDGTVAGMYVFSDVSRIMRDDAGHFNVDKNGRLLTAAAVPTDPDGIERVRAMLPYLDVVVLDSAQGDSKYAVTTLGGMRKLVNEYKEEFSSLDIVVGNVSEGESALMLANEGADGIKVGQGPGSICSTRPETGIGTPQVTAVYECVKAVKGMGVPICADGGITNPGDIPIAIAAGAHSVMIGSKFAGTKEAPGEIVVRNGVQTKLYRGMGSPSAMKESAASRKRYGQEGVDKPLAEGVEGYVPYKGTVVDVVDHYAKALRKGMSYVGSGDIETHRRDVRFWRMTGSGIRESHPHDIDQT